MDCRSRLHPPEVSDKPRGFSRSRIDQSLTARRRRREPDRFRPYPVATHRAARRLPRV